jgi:hypothetical protein
MQACGSASEHSTPYDNANLQLVSIEAAGLLLRTKTRVGLLEWLRPVVAWKMPYLRRRGMENHGPGCLIGRERD